jgi:DNA polymerase V
MLPSASLNGVGIPNDISQLDTWPACTPVNASPSTLRSPTHDSGPMWLAGPSSYDSFIHYFLPVFPAH